ncbi:FAD-binding oxidoreductase [Aeromicrobium sp. PE09-221]|uniref:FAD-binding oxidoreductase n=1 Tax=Aeromicrobium sp. PE09-221 TaxID=1898043 RepID=UPI000B75ACC6|nr:FAD-binding oxidoreductase [Aeromicrobium sp. PE09-221]OUZ12387.1 FAD-binding oxidoreductase [Aeromicrobium sp. PE09-221]
MGRSWWGWGTTEDALSRSDADDLAATVAQLLPGADLTAHEPPEPRSIAVPASRVEAPASLAHLCSDDHVDRLAHAHGQAFRDVVRALLGQVEHVPDLVARPRSEEDVVALLDWCSEAGIAVVPFGGGTSVVGGVEPRFDHDAGAVSLDLRTMSRVLEVDDTSQSALIEAGVLGPALEAQLRPHGHTLRFYPQSFEFSTLGGWIATRAGGHFATGSTHIDDLVESIRTVTPSGTMESRRLPGSGAGPSPDRLILGSEGALGIVTRAWMRIRERPRWRAAATVSFADEAAGVRAVRAITQSGLQPANCRFLDATEATINAGASSAILVLGFESADHPLEPWMERAVEICRDQGGVLAEPPRYTGSADAVARSGASDAWRSAFLRMPYQRDALAARSMIVETFETACTWDRYDELRAAVTTAAEAAMRSLGLPGVVTCRFTHVYPDGPAPYFGIYAAGTWGSTVEQWDEIKAAVSEAINTAGGTITHHHAVGRDHRPWYDRQRPDLFAAALAGAKRELDPAGILNPGILLG